jgi:hypothetical protein
MNPLVIQIKGKNLIRFFGQYCDFEISEVDSIQNVSSRFTTKNKEVKIIVSKTLWREYFITK